MLAARWTTRLPDSYKAAVVAGGGGRRHRQLRAALHRRRAPSTSACSNERAAERARAGLYRPGGKVALSRRRCRSSSTSACASSRAPDAPARRRRRDVFRTSACSGPTDRRSTSPSAASAWRTRSRRSGAASRVGLVEPAGLSAGLTGGSSRSCARTAPTASASARASPRATRTTCSRPTRTCRQAHPPLRAALRPVGARDEAAEAALREDILADLEAVPSLDHDRILRNQLGLDRGDLRTNAYRPGRRSIAFKLRSADVPAIPQPAPLSRSTSTPPRSRASTCAAGDRPRRTALVGPHRRPHRGLRPDARADDQERGDRARRRQGPLLPCASARRTRPR